MPNFPTILVLVTAFFLTVALLDWLIEYGHKRRGGQAFDRSKQNKVVEYSRSLISVMIIVLLIRSFGMQLYRIPSGSLEPTVMPGDMVFVTQFTYGLHWPVWHHYFVRWSKPKLGQVAPFYSPVNPKVTLIKRVLGRPGDDISYVHKVFYINGYKMKQRYIGETTDSDTPNGPHWKVKIYEENLNGVKHKIYIRPDVPEQNFYHLIVPQGKYFMIGDNRDNSDDSRYWGFVSMRKMIGEAQFVVLNWNPNPAHFWQKINWHRIGDRL